MVDALGEAERLVGALMRAKVAERHLTGEFEGGPAGPWGVTFTKVEVADRGGDIVVRVGEPNQEPEP
jgi:hypothetical protein